MKVRITVCTTKLHTGGNESKTGPSAKLHNTTTVTFTRLLAIRIVAKRRSGALRSLRISEPEEVSSSSSRCDSVSEKKAISLPETNPDIIRQSNANNRAMILATENPVAGRGSISNVLKIS